MHSDSEIDADPPDSVDTLRGHTVPSRYHSSNWEWDPPERVTMKWQAQFEKEEAPFRALSRQRWDLECDHPRNLANWKEMSKAKQRFLVHEWEETAATLRAEMDRCPLAALSRSSGSAE